MTKAFDRVWHAGPLHKIKSYGISGQIFGLISSFLSNRGLRVFLDGKSSQEYPVNAGVPQGSILGPFFLSPEVALYLYKSIIRPCMEYCCHVWAGALICYFELLDKLQDFRSFTCCFS